MFPPKKVEDPLHNEISYKYADGEVDLETKDEHLSIKEDISIYPNPNPGTFNLELYDVTINEFTIEITNMMGTRIYYRDNVSPGLTQINISAHATGIYFIKIQADTKTFLEKVVYK